MPPGAGTNAPLLISPHTPIATSEPLVLVTKVVPSNQVSMHRGAAGAMGDPPDQTTWPSSLTSVKAQTVPRGIEREHAISGKVRPSMIRSVRALMEDSRSFRVTSG